MTNPTQDALKEAQSIKTWQERAGADAGVRGSCGYEGAMQAEIDELRAALASIPAQDAAPAEPARYTVIFNAVAEAANWVFGKAVSISVSKLDEELGKHGYAIVKQDAAPVRDEATDEMILQIVEKHLFAEDQRGIFAAYPDSGKVLIAAVREALSTLSQPPAADVRDDAKQVAGNCFVQPVPDHCDRITWRNQYFHLPLTSVGRDATQWAITAPDGRTWHGDSPLRAAAAAQRDTIDPVVAMARINAAIEEDRKEDEAEAKQIRDAALEEAAIAIEWKRHYDTSTARECVKTIRALKSSPLPEQEDRERLDWMLMHVNCDEVEGLDSVEFGLSKVEHLAALREAIDAARKAKS